MRTLEGHTGAVWSVAYSSDGKQLISGSSDKTIRIWDSVTGRLLQTLSGHRETVSFVVFSTDGEYIASGSADKTVRIWDASNGRLLQTLTGHTDRISSISYSKNGKYMASGSWDNTIKISYAIGALEVMTLKGHSDKVYAVAFSPDGKYLASGSSDKLIKIWDIRTGKEYRNITGCKDAVWALAYSSDGKFIAGCAADGSVRILDAFSGEVLHDLEGHRNPVRSIAYSPDGKFIATGASDGVIKLWASENGQCLATMLQDSKDEWVTWTPEGFLIGSDWTVKNLSYFAGGSEVDISRVYDTVYRPDLVSLKLSKQDISAFSTAAALSAAASSTEVPVVSLEILTDTEAESVPRDVQLSIKVTDRGAGIGRVLLQFNGRTIVLADDLASSVGESIVLQHTVSLQPGENVLSASAYDDGGIVESSKNSKKIEWTGPESKGPARLFVMTVAVDDYQDISINKLNNCVADAAGLVETFKTQAGGIYAEIIVKSLRNADVTKDGLEKAFSELGRQVGPDDSFVLYLAGHGKTGNDGDYYYIPWNFVYNDAESIPEYGVSKWELMKDLSNIQAGSMMVFMDTCNSGSFLSGSDSAADAKKMGKNAIIDRFARKAGYDMLVASTNDQAALENYNGHGIFTWHIMEAMQGYADINKDGFVSSTELCLYVISQVPLRSMERWGYRQEPQRILQNPDFSLAENLLPEPVTAALLTEADLLYTPVAVLPEITARMAALSVQLGDTTGAEIVAAGTEKLPLDGVSYRDTAKVVYPGQTLDTAAGDGFVSEQTRNRIFKPFSIGRYEVTCELYYAVYAWALEHGYVFASACEEPDSAHRYEPQVNVSWRDAVVWCNAYSELDGKTPVYTMNGEPLRTSQSSAEAGGGEGLAEAASVDAAATGYRLPSEAEWEIAARGAKNDIFDWQFVYAGSVTPETVSWNAGNAENRIHHVGIKAPNRLGIFDMSGNVWEMCYNTFSADSAVRAGRGGCYFTDTAIGMRDFYYPYGAYDNYGFRVCLGEGNLNQPMVTVVSEAKATEAVLPAVTTVSTVQNDGADFNNRDNWLPWSVTDSSEFNLSTVNQKRTHFTGQPALSSAKQIIGFKTDPENIQLRAALQKGESIACEVIGDGNQWLVRLVTDGWGSPSYSFQTELNRSQSLNIPFDDFTGYAQTDVSSILGLEFLPAEQKSFATYNLQVSDIKITRRGAVLASDGFNPAALQDVSFWKPAQKTVISIETAGTATADGSEPKSPADVSAREIFVKNVKYTTVTLNGDLYAGAVCESPSVLNSVRLADGLYFHMETGAGNWVLRIKLDDGRCYDTPFKASKKSVAVWFDDFGEEFDRRHIAAVQLFKAVSGRKADESSWIYDVSADAVDVSLAKTKPDTFSLYDMVLFRYTDPDFPTGVLMEFSRWHKTAVGWNGEYQNFNAEKTGTLSFDPYMSVNAEKVPGFIYTNKTASDISDFGISCTSLAAMKALQKSEGLSFYTRGTYKMYWKVCVQSDGTWYEKAFPVTKEASRVYVSFADFGKNFNSELITEIRIQFHNSDKDGSFEKTLELADMQLHQKTPITSYLAENAKISGGARFAAMLVNPVGGLGSFCMGDVGGGVTVLAFESIGAGAAFWAYTTARDYRYYDYDPAIIKIVGYAGLGCVGVGVLISLIRPLVFDRPIKETHLPFNMIGKPSVAFSSDGRINLSYAIRW